MKTLIISAILATALCNTANAYTEHDESNCQSVGDMAALVARDRDAGLMQYQIEEKVKAHTDDPAMRTAFKNVAIMVYTWPQLVDATPNQVRSILYRNCINTR